MKVHLSTVEFTALVVNLLVKMGSGSSRYVMKTEKISASFSSTQSECWPSLGECDAENDGQLPGYGDLFTDKQTVVPSRHIT